MPFIPGPYAVDQVVSDGEYDIILDYDMAGEGSPILVGSTLGPDEDGPFSANQAHETAILWAAAPDLYTAACAAQHLLSTKVTTDGYDRDVLKIIEAAIAKVSGRRASEPTRRRTLYLTRSINYHVESASHIGGKQIRVACGTAVEPEAQEPIEAIVRSRSSYPSDQHHQGFVVATPAGHRVFIEDTFLAECPPCRSCDEPSPDLDAAGVCGSCRASTEAI